MGFSVLVIFEIGFSFLVLNNLKQFFFYNFAVSNRPLCLPLEVFKLKDGLISLTRIAQLIVFLKETVNKSWIHYVSMDFENN